MENNSEDFKKKIRQELEGLNKKEIVHFAWICSIRALPFLGRNEYFDFFKKDQFKNYITNIFYALDITISYKLKYNKAYRTSDVPDLVYLNDVDATVKSSLFASLAPNISDVIMRTVDSALSVYVAANSLNIDRKAFYVTIFDDLEIVKTKKGEHNNSINLYGEYWNKFETLLKNGGCIYWGKIYKKIFEDGLKIDERALRRRLGIPQEIRDQEGGTVIDYLEELEKEGGRQLNEARIIILGDKGSGKTSLARRLINTNAAMPEENESTAGVDTSVWQMKDENINVHIWDFAGHTVTHAVHRFFLSERCLYILVYNGRKEETFRLEYWLNHMKNYGRDSQAFILVNKRDNHRADIPINNLSDKYNIIGLYNFSIKDDIDDLKIFRENVSEYILGNPSWNMLEIPLNYYRVKEELENLFIRGNRYKGREVISRDEFNKIAQKHNVKKNEELLRNLHCLGISLWYATLDNYNTLILNPEWISHGVYSIINWVNDKKKHNISQKEFVNVFEESGGRYPENKHQFLFDLMKHYELAYECETSKGKELIIPHLLDEDRPSILPSFQIGESLMLRYKADQPLPPNTISRFIVKHNEEIYSENNQDLVWRFGVVLKNEHSLALIKEDDRTIMVSVKGVERSNYIGILRNTLNGIFESFKSERPELQYRVERFGMIPDHIEEKEPLWLSQKKIVNHYNKSLPYYDDTTNQEVLMKDLIQKYGIPIIINKIENTKVDDTVYEPKQWERFFLPAAIFMFVIMIMYLLFRNEPINDPNYVVYTRTILSLIVSSFGVSIPGYLKVSLDKKGIAIRAGGALGLFIVTYLLTPTVL